MPGSQGTGRTKVCLNANSECMPCETITSLNLLKSIIAMGVQAALTKPLSTGVQSTLTKFLSFVNSYKVTAYIKAGCLKTLGCSSLTLNAMLKLVL